MLTVQVNPIFPALCPPHLDGFCSKTKKNQVTFTLGRVGDDDVLAGDVLAAGLAMMFCLRSGLRGSQSRMARPTPSQPLREQGKICAGPRPSQGISNIGRSTRSQPGRFTTPRHHHDDARRTTGVTGVFLEATRSTRSQPGRFNTPRHARRTTGVTGVFLDALHAPKEFCLSLAAVQHTSLSHAASTQLRTRHFLMRLEQLHKSENRTLAKTDRRLEQLHQIAHLSVSLVHEFPLAAGTAPQIGKPDSH